MGAGRPAGGAGGPARRDRFLELRFNLGIGAVRVTETQRLDAARARTVAAAQQHGFSFAAPPRGLFGWVDTGCDTERLAEALLDAGWLIAPGTLFHATPRPTTLMRINFATTQDAAFWATLQHACRHILLR